MGNGRTAVSHCKQSSLQRSFLSPKHNLTSGQTGPPLLLISFAKLISPLCWSGPRLCLMPLGVCVFPGLGMEELLRSEHSQDQRRPCLPVSHPAPFQFHSHHHRPSKVHSSPFFLSGAAAPYGQSRAYLSCHFVFARSRPPRLTNEGIYTARAPSPPKL